MNATASALQPLLWVNHDAKNRKARPHRHTVFIHVQSSWKEWRRQEDALALRMSAKFMDSRLAKAPQPVTDILPSSGGKSVEFKSDNCPQEDDVTRDKQPHEDELRAMAAQAHPRTILFPHHQTILGKGNSDAFQAFAISINAPVADLLAYSRVKYLPEIFSHVNAPDVRAAVTRAFAETVTFLHDECTVYPQIAKIAAEMPKGSIPAEVAPQIPIFKMKGLALLRKKLTNPDSVLDPRTSASMMLFLTAELHEGNIGGSIFPSKDDCSPSADENRSSRFSYQQQC